MAELEENWDEPDPEIRALADRMTRKLTAAQAVSLRSAVDEVATEVNAQLTQIGADNASAIDELARRTNAVLQAQHQRMSKLEAAYDLLLSVVHDLVEQNEANPRSPNP